MSVMSPGKRPAAAARPHRAPEARRELRAREADVRELGAQELGVRELGVLSICELRVREVAARDVCARVGKRSASNGARRSGPGRPSHGVRLTRRGRWVLMVFITLLVMAAMTPFLLSAAAGAAADNHGVPPAAVYRSMTRVVVQPGETLWSIALQAAPTADPRAVIPQIMEINALSSEVVVPGERLWVPKG
jgi:hypothetical protein